MSTIGDCEKEVENLITYFRNFGEMYAVFENNPEFNGEAYQVDRYKKAVGKLEKNFLSNLGSLAIKNNNSSEIDMFLLASSRTNKKIYCMQERFVKRLEEKGYHIKYSENPLTKGQMLDISKISLLAQ